MPVNWNLAQQPNALAMMLQGFEQGRELKREQGVRNAMSALVKSPDDQAAFGQLADIDPGMALQYRGQQQTHQAAQIKAERDAIPLAIGMLRSAKSDPNAWQGILAKGQQLGIPGIDKAPAQFDPVWVDKQLKIFEAFEKDGGQKVSAAGQKAIDLGYQHGSPEFVQVVRQILEAEQSKPYVVGGETRLYKPSLAPQGAPQAAPQAAPQQAPKVTSFEAATGAAQKMGAQFPEFVRNNGFRVQVTTPEQARQLPSGTPLILPDGSEGVVP